MGVRSARTTRAYWRDIVAVLAAKAAALALIYGLFFSTPPSQPAPADHLFLKGAPR